MRSKSLLNIIYLKIWFCPSLYKQNQLTFWEFFDRYTQYVQVEEDCILTAACFSKGKIISISSNQL